MPGSNSRPNVSEGYEVPTELPGSTGSLYEHRISNPYQMHFGCMCVLCVFSSHSFWILNSLDVPAGVTQEEGHTGFFIHLSSAVRALKFILRRIQQFCSLVDREVEFCLRPTRMVTKNLYENGPNPFFFVLFNLMGTRMVQIRIAKSV